MTSNAKLGKKCIRANAIETQIELYFLSLKIWFFKKDNLIKNYDIAPNRLALKRSKLWKRINPTEINHVLILWQVNKFSWAKEFWLKKSMIPFLLFLSSA